MDNAIPQAMSDEMKIPVAGVDTSLLVVGQDGPRGPQNSTGYCNCSCSPTELNRNTLMLKTPHALVVGHRKINTELNWKLPPCWLLDIVPEGECRL